MKLASAPALEPRLVRRSRAVLDELGLAAVLRTARWRVGAA
ncbi:hypothetical protein [Aeromicrobium sp.]|nr:hypothetical protein [Aeromicrobium sp.]